MYLELSGRAAFTSHGLMKIDVEEYHLLQLAAGSVSTFPKTGMSHAVTV